MLLSGHCCSIDKDYYKILGVPKDASQDDIKKAFHSVSFITVQNILRYLWLSYDLFVQDEHVINLTFLESVIPFSSVLLSFVSSYVILLTLKKALHLWLFTCSYVASLQNVCRCDIDHTHNPFSNWKPNVILIQTVLILYDLQWYMF